MSNKSVITTNIKLSGELINFISSKPELAKKYAGCSYVVFSKDNPGLNKINESFITELKQEGKTVIRATQTDQRQNPWIFAAA